MSRTSRTLAALIGVAVLAACGDGPSAPSNPPPPPPPPGNVVTSVRIEGPAAIAPESSAQFRLIATFTNGSTSDVAAQATWTSDNASVLSIASPGGLATGKSRGEVHLGARYQNRTSNIVVLVLEDGTFRLRGVVIESGAGLSGARVDVLAGTGTGLSTTTDASGSYALYGVAGEVQLEAALDGYEKKRQSIVVTSHNANANIELRPTIEPSDLRGDWRMTFTASTACGSVIPPDTANRSYDVTITQSGTFVQVQIKNPVVAASWLRLTGRVVDRSVTMFLPTDDFYYPFYGLRYYALVETFAAGRNLAFGGTMRGERAGSVVSGIFDGEFAVYRGSDGQGGVWNRESSCQRGDHSFSFEKN